MSYFKMLLDNYKLYRNFHKWFPKSSKYSSKIPSETWVKHHPSSTFNGKKVLNVGCGKCVFKASNVTNLDAFPGDGVNVVWDLSKTPLPFESNTFDLIIANHVLEHIPDWWECFKELARIVKVGGSIEVWIPPISSDSAFAYRDHINYIGTESFSGCASMSRSGTNLAAAEDHKEVGDVSKLYVDARHLKVIMEWWILIAPEWLQVWMCDHLRNVVSEIGYLFKKGE